LRRFGHADSAASRHRIDQQRRHHAVQGLKRVHRATWAAGDYAAVTELIDEAPPQDLLAAVGAGQAVLDVATRTGNIAIRAAAAAAHIRRARPGREPFETAGSPGRWGTLPSWRSPAAALKSLAGAAAQAIGRPRAAAEAVVSGASAQAFAATPPQRGFPHLTTTPS
jgi:hypothetical protein